MCECRLRRRRQVTASCLLLSHAPSKKVSDTTTALKTLFPPIVKVTMATLHISDTPPSDRTVHQRLQCNRASRERQGRAKNPLIRIITLLTALCCQNKMKSRHNGRKRFAAERLIAVTQSACPPPAADQTGGIHLLLAH